MFRYSKKRRPAPWIHDRRLPAEGFRETAYSEGNDFVAGGTDQPEGLFNPVLGRERQKYFHQASGTFWTAEELRHSKQNKNTSQDSLPIWQDDDGEDRRDGRDIVRDVCVGGGVTASFHSRNGALLFCLSALYERCGGVWGLWGCHPWDSSSGCNQDPHSPVHGLVHH